MKAGPLGISARKSRHAKEYHTRHGIHNVGFDLGRLLERMDIDAIVPGP
jgi:hypothetical protein